MIFFERLVTSRLFCHESTGVEADVSMREDEAACATADLDETLSSIVVVVELVSEGVEGREDGLVCW